MAIEEIGLAEMGSFGRHCLHFKKVFLCGENIKK